MRPESDRRSESHDSGGCASREASEPSLHQQLHPDHEVHDANVSAEESVRTVSPLRQPLLLVHRSAQLGSGDQRFREGDLHDAGHFRARRDSH